MAERIAELGAQTRQTLIENMAKVLDDRPMKGTKIGHQRELELWVMPTSPAAVIAFEKGATFTEAEQANVMWAQQMKADGATDEQVFQTCRKFAYQRGKYFGKADPEKEAAYHERMAARAARWRLGQAEPADEMDGEEGLGNGSSDEPAIQEGRA